MSYSNLLKQHDKSFVLYIAARARLQEKRENEKMKQRLYEAFGPLYFGTR